MSSSRVQLIARLAPPDKAQIERRAREEGRTYGEVLALILQENELLKSLQGREA